VIFCGYLGLTQFVPAADDELYYWCWAKDLQLSYYDHPPLVGWMIAASTAAFGDTRFAVRLPACVASVTVLAVVAALSRTRALLAGIALTPPFSLGAVIVTPDTPLVLFWSLYLLWLVAAHRRLDEAGRVSVGMWAVGGLLLGLSALGKYTTGLAVPAALLSFLLSGRPWRSWLPGYVGHGVVSAVVFLPVVAFNVQRDFAPLRYQWAHAMANPDPGGWRPLGEFVGVQLLLAGTLPFVLLPWAFARWRTLAADPALRACACLYAPPLAFFLYKAARGPLEGNWALAAYIGGWPVAAAWYLTVRHSPTWRWLTAAAFLLPAGATLVATAHLIHPLPVLSPEADRVTRQAVRLAIARRAAADAVREGLPVYTPTYQWTALLRFHGADARQMDGVSRPSHFTTPARRLSDEPRALVFNEGMLPADLAPGFGPPDVLHAYPLDVRGKRVGGFLLLRYGRPAN
jgi:4-amino-4-deoxy-L-arabinose transferase-like glycosyltransferase